jgi:L-lactate dehydrogenase complex protein LldF
MVTNEGNGRMVTTMPKVHVVITGIEKVIPTLEDLSTLMRLLPRSATGQSISNYFSILTGVKKPEEHDGPEHLYFVLVDSGRADVVGGDFHAMLRCIRCGACMNHCPVYQTIGGHAYGWVYPGPMGSVLTPLYAGIENSIDLPHAATLCNQCGIVCRSRFRCRTCCASCAKSRPNAACARSPNASACVFGRGWRSGLRCMRWARASVRVT